MAQGVEYFAARLHGRRSRLAEAGKLDRLCQLRSLSELGGAFYPGAELQSAEDFQRHLIQDLIRELSDLRVDLSGGGARLLAWILARFQVENLKVLLRGSFTQTPSDVLQAHLVVLPLDLVLDPQLLAAARSPEEFIQRLPKGILRARAEAMIGIYRDQLKPFFLEAVLDSGYFQELLARAERLAGQDEELIKAMVIQEADIFHLMLVVRGKFHYGLAPELLLPLHLEGAGISRARFAAMLADADLPTAAARAVGRVYEGLPKIKQANGGSGTLDPAALEILAWQRFLHLANRAFRRSHMGLGAIVGYAGIRRVEIANLITLSEGIRAGMAAESIRARMIPRGEVETADYV